MTTSWSPLADGLLRGDRRSLAKAITLLESQRDDQRADADALLRHLMPHSGRALRLGVSGSPGVGKSTFIEALGQRLVDRGRKLAVLAIDPSSPLTGGSILGDRTRMEALSRHPAVFIRPSPTGGALGGVARRTREVIIACEAAGYDTVFVETVGVGQSETLAAGMVDAFLILHQPHSGDELQGLKRGLLELADLVAVTKADGDLAAAARLAKAQLDQALGVAGALTGRKVPVTLVSSHTGAGLDDLWAHVERSIAAAAADGTLASRRRAQAHARFREELGEQLRTRVFAAAGRPDLMLA
jgi:LAO/AO transport system kinase